MDSGRANAGTSHTVTSVVALWAADAALQNIHHAISDWPVW